MNNESVIVNELIKLIIPALAALVIGYTIKTLKPMLTAFVDDHLDTSQQIAIRAAFEMATHSTEAMRIRAALSGMAFDALQTALKLADDELTRRGINLDTEAITAGLLAELHRLNMFTDTTKGMPTTGGDAGMVETSMEGGTRSVLAADIPPQPDASALKSLMWL